jgi:hypothetical protein
MEDHETRRKVIRQWMSLPKDNGTQQTRPRSLLRRQSSRTNFRLADVTRMKE